MVLSRTHTQQYPYRWAAILADELAAQGVDPRYFSFCSAALPVQQRLMAAADKADKAAALTAAAAARGETGVRVITAADAYADLAPTPTLFTGARALAAELLEDVRAADGKQRRVLEPSEDVDEPPPKRPPPTRGDKWEALFAV